MYLVTGASLHLLDDRIRVKRFCSVTDAVHFRGHAWYRIPHISRKITLETPPRTNFQARFLDKRRAMRLIWKDLDEISPTTPFSSRVCYHTPLAFEKIDSDFFFARGGSVFSPVLYVRWRVAATPDKYAAGYF